MKLSRPLPRQRPETITSLIDVVFFLLVFFMLIGRMDATAPFDVMPPLALSGADMPAGGLTVSISADGMAAFEGQVYDSQSVAAAVREQIAETPDALIRINAHRDAELRHVLPLIGRLEAAGAAEVVLVVTPEPEAEG